MKILDRYLSGQILSTVSWAVGLLTIILVLGNVLRDLLGLLISHQVPVIFILTFIGYLLPFSMIYSIPWGVLVAVLLVFGRLSSDNELVALRANGVGMTRICFSVFTIAILFLGLCLWINLYVAPIAQMKIRSAVFDLASSEPLALFGSDEVIEQFPHRKIYVGKKEGSTLYDLHIFEMNSQNLPMRVIYARRGNLEVDQKNEQILLHVFDASYEERDLATPEDLKKMRHGITMREGVLAISLEELLRKAREYQHPNELTLNQLRDASHELKTPLTIMRGEIESALKTEVDNPRIESLLDALLAETQRLCDIVEKLLLLSRADAGALTLTKEILDYSAICYELAEDAQILARPKRINTKFEIASDVKVLADESHLRRVLLNLLDNAIKYNVKGGALSISLTQSGALAALRIANTGLGIPKDHENRVFERFYRADPSRSSEISGSGLGLSICREIVAAHGGQLWLEQLPSGWTAFTVALSGPKSEDSSLGKSLPAQDLRRRSPESPMK